MKYQLELDIKLPREIVIELFDSVENLYKWQPGLISFDHLSGTRGEVGQKSKLVYQMGKRKIEMIETLTKKDFPNEFAGTYEAKGVFNIISNKFYETTPDTTKWVIDNEFQFSGFFMKLMTLIMPGIFKKQTKDIMERFKKFAEAEKI